MTLAFSHYNEKARWALDYCGVPYDDRRLMPGFSQVGVMLATRGRGGTPDKVSSRWSTPVLITRDGDTLCDSTAIALWASSSLAGGGDGPLFPQPAVRDLVVELGRELGPYTRLIGYWHLLRDDQMMAKLARDNVSRRQALAFRAFSPVGKILLRRGLRIDDKRYGRALERARTQLALAEQRLAGRRYLVGDRFTAADLTFASLMAPLLLIQRDEGYSAGLPGLDDLSEDARALVTEIRASPAGRFALEMFRRHRHSRHDAS